MYKIFKAAFFSSIVLMIVFFYYYFDFIFTMINNAAVINESDLEKNPFLIFKDLFTPVFFVVLVLMIVCQWTYIILGIVFAARNRSISGGEKALWIIGFLLFSFITAIVFMVLNRSRNLVGNSENDNRQGV